MPDPLSHTPTGIFPAWIPADQFTPDTPRLVLCSDGEGTFIGVFEPADELLLSLPPEWIDAATGLRRRVSGCRISLPPEWIDAATEEPFDSIITHWMECPPAPES